MSLLPLSPVHCKPKVVTFKVPFITAVLCAVGWKDGRRSERRKSEICLHQSLFRGRKRLFKVA